MTTTRPNRELQTMGDLFGPPGAPGPPDVRARARRLVAARATDPEDCRLLLDALGLLDGEAAEGADDAEAAAGVEEPADGSAGRGDRPASRPGGDRA
ncbi:hypothetical protein ACFCX4_35190 [Kitasatospora sp. NPDC056327]|uniref:hypothetical protein n=1 Tax=Kitasatospora sp. NPDC056327 TaxID=3345785 RepID=UPI0035D8F0AF